MNFQTTIEAPSTAAPVSVRMLNTQEAADYLGLAKNTLEKARTYGDGPYFTKFSSRAVRYAIEDLDAWIAKHRAASSAELDERARARITRKEKAKASANGVKQELGGNPCLHSSDPNHRAAVR
jgi:predicted DNA-binding transcriptional regulator AlpA